MTEYLDRADAISLISEISGTNPDSIVRDWGLLESALLRPRTTVFGEDAFADIHQKAAALLQALACNHPLLDGNKRLAWLSTRLFYVYNGKDLRAPSPQAGDQFVRAIAASTVDTASIALTLGDWTGVLRES